MPGKLLAWTWPRHNVTAVETLEHPRRQSYTAAINEGHVHVVGGEEEGSARYVTRCNGLSEIRKGGRKNKGSVFAFFLCVVNAAVEFHMHVVQCRTRYVVNAVVRWLIPPLAGASRARWFFACRDHKQEKQQCLGM